MPCSKEFISRRIKKLNSCYDVINTIMGGIRVRLDLDTFFEVSVNVMSKAYEEPG